VKAAIDLVELVDGSRGEVVLLRLLEEAVFAVVGGQIPLR
jgi:hypothetical protein